MEEITIGKKKIKLNIKKPKTRKKRIKFTYDPLENLLTIRATYFMENKKIKSILHKNQEKLENMVENNIKNEEGSKFHFKSGARFPYLGEKYQLQIEEKVNYSNQINLAMYNKKFFIKVDRDINQQKKYQLIRKSLINWYRTRARPKFKERVKKYFYIINDYSSFNFDFQDIHFSIQDNVSRWASANITRPSLNFTWHLIMFPEDILDAVIVHELAHFAVPGSKGKRHFDSFYQFCEKIIPDYRKKFKYVHEHTYYLYF